MVQGSECHPERSEAESKDPCSPVELSPACTLARMYRGFSILPSKKLFASCWTLPRSAAREELVEDPYLPLYPLIDRYQDSLAP